METPQKTKLEVGDVLYIRQWSIITGTLTITRVTDKRAFAKVNGSSYEQQFNREIDGFGVKLIGRMPYGPTYQIETPQLRKAYGRILLVKDVKDRLEKVKPEGRTTDELTKIQTFLTELGI